MSAVLRPYILAASVAGGAGDIAAQTDRLVAQLQGAGFRVLGRYSPNERTAVVAATNAELEAAAGKSEHGSFGGVLRFGVTAVDGGQLQISHQNPIYMSHVYRMEADLTAVADQLRTLLGCVQEFGSAKGLEAKKLRKYHYTLGMPFFTDLTKLKAFPAHSEAVAAVEAGLAASKTAVKVYRFDCPDKDESIFGVGITSGDGADGKVLDTCDTDVLKHTCHLPYELIVSKGVVSAFDGKFRIAQSFPDLSMGVFMKIVTVPGGIERTLKSLVSPQ